MKIVKVNSLPQAYETDTVYIVKSPTSGLISEGRAAVILASPGSI